VKPKIPWSDVVIFYPLALIGTAAAIFAWGFTDAALWGKILTTIVAAMAVGGASWRLRSAWNHAKKEAKNAQPNFTVESIGTKVWTDGIEEITEDLIDDALFYFMAYYPIENPVIDTITISQLLEKTKIHFKKKSEKAGLQNGNWIEVRWNGTINSSAFFHELAHLCDEYLGIFDFEHSDEKTWDAVKKLNARYDG
jgi:hypothetical protein